MIYIEFIKGNTRRALIGLGKMDPSLRWGDIAGAISFFTCNEPVRVLIITPLGGVLKRNIPLSYQ
ncbi:MAG: hypothetical protein EBQ80_02795 [Proteobacteria bacterium]|nr:hypothetical protein [Pseudomonadota bacterium]